MSNIINSQLAITNAAQLLSLLADTKGKEGLRKLEEYTVYFPSDMALLDDDGELPTTLKGYEDLIENMLGQAQQNYADGAKQDEEDKLDELYGLEHLTLLEDLYLMEVLTDLQKGIVEELIKE